MLEHAAHRGGLPLGEWLRVLALTAAGAGEMLGQLRRVEASRRDRLDSFVRRRIPELREGVGTPFWTRAPAGVRRPQVTELTTERINYGAGIAMFIDPSKLSWRLEEIWPPSRHAAPMTAREIKEGVAAGTIDSRELYREIEGRRAATAEMLNMRSLGRCVKRAHMYEQGFELDAILASDASEEHEQVKPHAHAMVRRSGAAESVIALDAKRGAELSLDRIARLPELLGRELSLLHELGAEVPYLLSVVVFGVQGRTLRGPSPDRDIRDYVRGTPLADDVVVLPIVEITDPAAEPLDVLRQPLDALWQEAGLRECHLTRPGR